MRTSEAWSWWSDARPRQKSTADEIYSMRGVQTQIMNFRADDPTTMWYNDIIHVISFYNKTLRRVILIWWLSIADCILKSLHTTEKLS